MFRWLKNERGASTGIATGIACLALAGITADLGVPAPLKLLFSPILLLLGIVLIVANWRRIRAGRYDLTKLWEHPAADPLEVEPWPVEFPERQAQSPYCGWCDEVYPPGNRRCTVCGRDL